MRASLGIENERADVDHFLRILDGVARRPRTLRDRFSARYHGAAAPAWTPVQARIEAQAGERAERCSLQDPFEALETLQSSCPPVAAEVYSLHRFEWLEEKKHRFDWQRIWKRVDPPNQDRSTSRQKRYPPGASL